MVASQLKILIPVGTAMAIVDSTKNVFAFELMPTVNMWWAQTLMLMNPMATRCRHHHRVAEDRFARKDRDDFGNKRECRNDQNIDFRVTEDPEEVHPDHGRAAGLRVEEMSAQIAVDQQHDLRSRERADGKQHQAGHHQVQPDQQRHLSSVIPGQRMHKIVATILIAVPMLPNAGDQQGQGPEIGAVSAREGL